MLPLGVLLAIKLIPPAVLAECRARAEELVNQEKPTNWIGAVAIVLIWLLCAGLVTILVFRWFF